MNMILLYNSPNIILASCLSASKKKTQLALELVLVVEVEIARSSHATDPRLRLRKGNSNAIRRFFRPSSHSIPAFYVNSSRILRIFNTVVFSRENQLRWT